MYPQSVPALISKNVGNTLANYKTWGGILYNVKEYGAKGDFNITTKTGSDDTAPVLKAVNAAIAAGGGIIWFPDADVYKITDKLPVTGPNILFYGPGATLYFANTTGQPLIHIYHTHDVSVIGLKFDSDPAYTRDTTAAFVWAVNSYNVHVQNNIMDHCASASIYITDGSYDVFVTGNTISDTKADGVHCADSVHDIIIADNIFKNTGDDAIGVVWYPGTTTTAPQDILIHDNIIHTPKGAGVTVCHGKYISIDNNTIIGSWNGINVYYWLTRTDNADGVYITNNKIRDVGVDNSNIGIYINGAVNVVVEGNTIENTSATAIVFGYFENLKIKNNIIKNTGTYGIQLIVSNGYTGLKELFIEGNLFDNIGHVAIWLDPYLTTRIANVFIHDNKVYKNDRNLVSAAFIYVAKVDALRVISNHNYTGTDSVIVDNASCTDVIIGDNYPQPWLAYTPIVTAITGSITTYAASGEFERKGNTIYFTVSVTLTNIGTATGGIKVTLPIPQHTGRYIAISGVEAAMTGLMLSGFISDQLLTVKKYDGTFPGTSGSLLVLSGAYEIV